MDIKPDISGSLPIIGDAVSEAEGQQTEEDTEEQPAKKRKIDHEEQEKVGFTFTILHNVISTYNRVTGCLSVCVYRRTLLSAEPI